MRKYQDNGLVKHRKLHPLNSDWNPTERILLSDSQQLRRKKEFEEKKSNHLC